MIIRFRTMKNILNGISRWLIDAGRVFRNEWSVVLGDAGVLLFFIALPLCYPIVYTLIYNPEVVTKLPVAVVDDSRTPLSRKLVQDASASPAIDIYGYASDLNEARRMHAEGKVYGIMQIPSDYSRNITNGRQAHITFYCDMSLLLRYRTFASALTDLQMKTAADVTFLRMAAAGASTAGLSSLPVNNQSNFLGDTQQGFASFVIPGIVILILQQSMILGITVIGASSRERRRRNRGYDPLMIEKATASATIWGKSLCYTMIYIPVTLYILHYIPVFFNLPHHGAPVDYLLFVFPLLLGSSFLGQTLVLFTKEREIPFMLIVFTSVIFLFLSGLTWPRYAMNALWKSISDCIPATWGVEGFIRINNNGATLADNAGPFTALWILAGVYCLTAWWVTAWTKHKDAECPKINR